MTAILRIIMELVAAVVAISAMCIFSFSGERNHLEFISQMLIAIWVYLVSFKVE